MAFALAGGLIDQLAPDRARREGQDQAQLWLAAWALEGPERNAFLIAHGTTELRALLAMPTNSQWAWFLGAVACC